MEDPLRGNSDRSLAEYSDEELQDLSTFLRKGKGKYYIIMAQ